MNLNHKQVADTLDEIAELFTKLSGTFRSGGSSSGSDEVDATSRVKIPAKPARPTSKSKPAEAVEITEDDVREKLKELAGSKGKDAMVAALESVGAAKLGEVDESQYGELIAKADELLADDGDAPAAKKAGPKKPAAKKAGPTVEQVVEAAKALIDADKPAYIKLTKKLGKPTEMDESGYADAIAAYEAAMPDDDENLV